ncbi:MAG: YbaB/EbfC family nucleoid-associated protein [Planctomycetes bacterium]|nr:YbaB/EbfC family nucleoid-associated protein [Planctomycetota bacterium]
MAKRNFGTGGGGFGGIDPSDMMRQAQKMQKDMHKTQDELNKKIVKGTAGGEMVVAFINGARQIVKLEINPEVVDPDDVDILEDTIMLAINQAMEKANKMIDKEMGKHTGGMNLPGIM